jgi:hypothetical protein
MSDDDWTRYADPQDMPLPVWRAWIDAGHPPLPKSQPDAEAPQFDCGVPFTPANLEQMIMPVLRDIARVEGKRHEKLRRELREEVERAIMVAKYEAERRIAAGTGDVIKAVEEVRREILKEVRAEIRRSMNADDTVVHLEDLRRHG